MVTSTTPEKEVKKTEIGQARRPKKKKKEDRKGQGKRKGEINRERD